MSDQKQQEPKLTLPPDVAMGHYSNFVMIAHNYTEVVLDFGRTLPGRQDIPVVARMIMTPFQAKQLLRALQHNLTLYENSFGPIAAPPVQEPAGPSAHSAN